MVARPTSIPPHVPPECVVEIDLYRMPGSERDLHAGWKELQDSSPRGLFWTPLNGGHWLVTRAPEIARIYADHQNFSSRITIVPRKWGEMFPLKPTTLDPPAHRPYRRLLNEAFSTTVVRAAHPRIRELVVNAIEPLRERGRCEFISEFAERLPLLVFLHLADLPLEGALALPRYGEEPLRSDGTLTEVPIMDRFANYLRPIVAERKKHPGADLISRLVSGDLDGRPSSEDEAVELCTAALTGGLDTMVSMLGLALGFLAQNPGHRQQLIDDPARVRPAVAELLRRFPIMTKARLVLHDQQIEGITLKAGDMVVLPPLHGLDEREFDEPLRVDFDRSPAHNCTFGNGVHRCPGASLTQLQLEVTVAEWLARIPAFALDPVQPPTFRGGVLGAMLRLDLHWDPKTTRSTG